MVCFHFGVNLKMHPNMFWAICIDSSESHQDFSVLNLYFPIHGAGAKQQYFDGHGRWKKEAARSHQGAGHEHSSLGMQENEYRGGRAMR